MCSRAILFLGAIKAVLWPLKFFLPNEALNGDRHAIDFMETRRADCDRRLDHRGSFCERMFSRMIALFQSIVASKLESAKAMLLGCRG